MFRIARGSGGRVSTRICGILVLVWVVGCTGASTGDPVAHQTVEPSPPTGRNLLPATEAEPSVAPVASEELADGLAAGELPLRFPGSPGSGGKQADDILQAEPPLSGGGLPGLLRQTIEMSPIFDETGVQDGLAESLNVAGDALSRQKQENRRSIREANRQVRVGQARLSPNLLLISVEGLGYGDLSCYGQNAWATGNVDRLAERGLRFTEFYAGSARGRASRWCVMTGLNTGRAPVVNEGRERFTLAAGVDYRVLPDVLWDSGYATGLVGVWDERRTPLEFGYDEWSGFRAAEGVCDSYPEVVHLDGTQAGLPGNADGRHGVHAGDLLLQESLSFLERYSRGERPWFLHLALPVFDEASHNSGVDMPANVAELERLIGGILDCLDEWELSARTCVMLMGVSAPNGAGQDDRWARTAGLRVHESGLSEGNLRVPLIVRWDTQIAAGTVSEHVCAAWDILPTLADLVVAVRRPQRLDGLSFAGTLLGRSQSDHRLLYWETREHGFGQAVRLGRWKGVRLPRQTGLSLFDLAADPGELHDLSDARPEIVEQLVIRE